MGPLGATWGHFSIREILACILAFYRRQVGTLQVQAFCRELNQKKRVCLTLGRRGTCCLGSWSNLATFVLLFDFLKIVSVVLASESRYQEIQVPKNPGTRKSRYQKVQVPENTGTRKSRYQRVQVPESPGTRKSGYQKVQLPERQGRKK